MCGCVSEVKFVVRSCLSVLCEDFFFFCQYINENSVLKRVNELEFASKREGEKERDREKEGRRENQREILHIFSTFYRC